MDKSIVEILQTLAERELAAKFDQDQETAQHFAERRREVLDREWVFLPPAE